MSEQRQWFAVFVNMEEPHPEGGWWGVTVVTALYVIPAMNEDEARGKAISAALEKKRGASVRNVGVLPVPVGPPSAA